MAARKHREIHDVEQTKKMVPFVTRETTFGQHVRKWVLGINICDLDFGSKLILSNNQSDATLWVLDTCLSSLDFVPFDDHVRLPKIHKIRPEVDLESSRSPAKSES